MTGPAGVSLLCVLPARVVREYGMRANWEPLVENSSDGYHSFSTHGACFEYLVWLSGDLGRRVRGVTRGGRV
jgi:hypothetical protein